MRLRRLLLLFVLFSPAGCSFYYYGARNLVSGPFDVIQECAFRVSMRREAHAAWKQIDKDDRKAFSPAYVKGFEDGFVDFVDAAGTGEPPAIAPAHLRRGLLASEAGQQDIEDWFAGFRHGAQVARESGLREKHVMPISDPGRTPQDPLPAQVVVPIPGVDQPKNASQEAVPVQNVVPAPALLPTTNLGMRQPR